MSQAVVKKVDPSEYERPSVFAYQEYKDFLRDYLHYLKLLNSEFSNRKFAMEAGLSSSYLPMLLNTAQEISAKAVEKMIPPLNLSGAEASYFRILCSIHQTAGTIDREEAHKKLQTLQKFSQLSPHETLVSRHFSQWYHVAIREMANEPGFQFNPTWVQKRLNFSVGLNEVKKALEFLFQNGLIVMKNDGTFASSGERLVCEGSIFRFILTHLYKQMFVLAEEAIDNCKRENRNIRSHTMCLSPDKFAEAKATMDEAIEKIAKLSVGGADGSAVYQFQMLAFPLTKVEGEDK